MHPHRGSGSESPGGAASIAAPLPWLLLLPAAKATACLVVAEAPVPPVEAAALSWLLPLPVAEAPLSFLPKDGRKTGNWPVIAEAWGGASSTTPEAPCQRNPGVQGIAEADRMEG